MENKRIRVLDEAKKAQKREEFNQKKDEEKTQDSVGEKRLMDEDIVKLTDRQREAFVAQKEKEERNKQRKEEMRRADAAQVMVIFEKKCFIKEVTLVISYESISLSLLSENDFSKTERRLSEV